MTTTAVQWTESERLAWKRPTALSVSEWADRHRELGDYAAEPGRWRTSRTPYLRESMDGFSTRGVEQVTLWFSTQVGKTEAMVNMLGFAVDQDPGPTCFVMPREQDALRMLNVRVEPMFSASSHMRRNLTGRKHDWSKGGEVQFKRSALYMAWARSPASLASNAIRYAFFDEADKAPRWSGKEADPLDLLRERLRTFTGISKLAVSSTGTTREGRIYKEWETSDRRKYWVPCPHCGKYQVLTWSQVKFPSNVQPRVIRAKNLARYLCELCERQITDGQKLEILARGKWVAEEGSIDRHGNVTEPEIANPNRGYHLWAAYSPWLTFSDIAAKFLEAERSGLPEKLMNFVNSWLAELWEEKLDEPRRSLIEVAKMDYAEGEVPDEVLVITAGADVQKSDIYYSVWGWGMDQRVWLLVEKRIRKFEQLEELVVRARFGPRHIPCRMLCVDSRWRSYEVHNLAREFPENVCAITGVEKNDPVPFVPRKVDRDPSTGALYKKSLQVWSVNVGMFKDQLSASMSVGPAPGKPRAFHLHSDPSREFCHQMTSEQKVLIRSAQGVRARWVVKEGRSANHFWDTAVYAYAAAEMVHVNLMTTKAKERHDRKKRRRRKPGRRGADL